MPNELTILFGSHLYGTSTEKSDKDYKRVFIPPAQSIVLGEVEDASHQNTKKDEHAKNTPSDIDFGLLSLKKFVQLLLAGDTMALDMVFAPDTHIDKPTTWWKELQWNRHKLLHKGTSKFADYVSGQADKYGIKGSRVAAFRIAKDRLASADSYSRVGDHALLLESLVKDNPFITVVDIPNKKCPDVQQLHLKLAQYHVPFSSRIDRAAAQIDGWIAKYGERALQAEKCEGIDWKAIHHAIRVSGQAVELLTTGHITFPRPDRELLLRVKKGELHPTEAFPLVEKGLANVIAANAVSKLPEEPDHAWARNFLTKHYLMECVDLAKELGLD